MPSEKAFFGVQEETGYICQICSVYLEYCDNKNQLFFQSINSKKSGLYNLQLKYAKSFTSLQDKTRGP